MKSPLKWVGSKRWLVPHLKPLWHCYTDKQLVEPFCGGLAIALGLKPSRALLNDINPHLINFYKWIVKGLIFDISMKNDEEIYYEYRNKFNTLIADGRAQSKEAAFLFYYLNRTCFNGLCRFNSKGEFNTPFGQYENIDYRSNFFGYQNILCNWNFVNKDFESLVLSDVDFIYADPPYDPPYDCPPSKGFNWGDQIRLAKWLASHKGPVIASNQATDRIIDLYKELNFKLIFIEAPRRMRSRIPNGENKTSKREILAVQNISQ